MSEVSICNLAVSWLSGNLITSLDDPQKEAKLCKANYADARDAVLEDADWTFATRRYRLTPEVAVPIYGYSHQFLIPYDVIRIIAVSKTGTNDSTNEETGLDWLKEENHILANEAVVYVRAIFRITDTNKFDSSFKHALAARIASDIAIPLTKSRSMQETMYALYQTKLGNAKSNDGRQGKREQIQAVQLTRARRAGYPI